MSVVVEKIQIGIRTCFHCDLPPQSINFLVWKMGLVKIHALPMLQHSCEGSK